LKERLTAEFKSNPAIVRLPRSDRRLSILIAGYIYRDTTYWSVYGVISNFERPDLRAEPKAEAFEEFVFSKGNVKPENPVVTVAIGNTAGVDVERIVAIRKQAQAGSPKSIAPKLVDSIRKAAFEGRSLETIGSQISSVKISPDRNSSVETGYHSAVVRRETTMPACVWATPDVHLAVSKISLVPVDPDTPPLSVPQVSGNQPCPCGSRKRYRYCHGRRPHRGLKDVDGRDKPGHDG
jgi:hypothetical protein